MHSDSEEGIQRLNQEAAKAMAYGARAGLTVAPERAILWLTANPAKSLGLSARVGTLEPGKMADVVVWNGTPVRVYAQADLVYIDGALRYDREHPEVAPKSDFLLGQPAAPGVMPMRARAVPLALLALAAASAHAADVLIRDATVHTMTSAGVLEHTDILIRDGRIAELGAHLASPADAELIEAVGTSRDARVLRRHRPARHRGDRP